MRTLFLLILVVFCLGCGGTNGSDFSIANSFMNNYANALESSSPNRVSALIASDYLNDCTTKADIVNTYADNIDSGLRYQEDVLEISNEFRDGDFIEFFGRVRERTYEGGDLVDDETFQGTFVIVDDGGTWRLYGNQACNGSFKKPEGKLKSHIVNLSLHPR